MSIFRRRLMGMKPDNIYINFKSHNVERRCITNWSTDKIGLTYTDAETVTSIPKGYGYFFGSKWLYYFNELQYFKNLKTIEAHSFENNDIEYITLPDSIQTIEDFAFNHNMADLETLKLIKIGNNVKTIGDNVFKGQNGVKIQITTPKPPSIKNALNSDDSGNIIKVDVYVPADLIYTYSKLWNKYANIHDISELNI